MLYTHTDGAYLDMLYTHTKTALWHSVPPPLCS